MKARRSAKSHNSDLGSDINTSLRRKNRIIRAIEIAVGLSVLGYILLQHW